MEIMEPSKQKIFLPFELLDDKSSINYDINIDFSENLNIKAQTKNQFPQKIFNASFSLYDLKNKSKFFKMFDSIEESFNDIKIISEQKSFYIRSNESSIILCIKKQLGIPDDIIFPLQKQSSDISKVVEELCLKNNNLEKKISELETKVNQLENELKINNTNLLNLSSELGLKNNNLEKKSNEIEKRCNGYEIKINELENELKRIKNNLSFFSLEEQDIIKNFFEINKPKNFNLIYRGIDRNNFFSHCTGKKNLLFLVEDKKGNKFGGYMSSTLINNKNANIEDKNAFIFSIQKRKKFKVKNTSKAIYITDGYFICFGGDSGGNDLYIGYNNGKNGGMNKKDTYNDMNYDITNNQNTFQIEDFKVYELSF